MDRNDVSVNLNDLEPNGNYVVCVIAMSEDAVEYEDEINTNFNETTSTGVNVTSSISQDIAAAILVKSSSNECISFNTYRKQITIELKTKQKFKLSSILSRRLGLIVGCSLGCIVFFIMVTVLLYTKIKERKRIAKSDPAWSEMNDYHSMAASKDDMLLGSTNASTDNILLGMAKNRQASLEQFK